MAKRSGSADLPLHGGRVPPWLAERVSELGAIVARSSRVNMLATSSCNGCYIPFASSRSDRQSRPVASALWSTPVATRARGGKHTSAATAASTCAARRRA